MKFLQFNKFRAPFRLNQLELAPVAEIVGEGPGRYQPAPGGTTSLAPPKWGGQPMATGMALCDKLSHHIEQPEQLAD